MTSAPQVTTRRNLDSGAAHLHARNTPPIFAGAVSIESPPLPPCPIKPVFAPQGAGGLNDQKGLCGQLDRSYYVADDGKSFNSIISGEKYTLC